MNWAFLLLISVSLISHASEANPLSAKLSALSCKTYVDERNVPHIQGADELTATACLGFFHGRDRGWQMDFLRRIGQGRKAEILGASEIKKDYMMRLLNLTAQAERIWNEMSEEDRTYLWAYTHGVNLGMARPEAISAYEHKYFGTKAEPWHPADSILVLLLQSLDQTRKSFEEQIKEEKRREIHGDASPTLFAAQGLPWEVTILKEGEYKKSATHASLPKPSSMNVASAEKILTELNEMLPEFETGSNNWIIAPSRTKSHKAFLANDPHLSLKHPPFWYTAHIMGGSLDAYGVTVPGVPLVASGVNRHLAWGLTNSYMNTADVAFIPKNEIQVKSSYPLIWFNFGPLKLPFFFKSTKITQDGLPIVPLESPDGHYMVLRWTGLDLVASDMSPLWKMNRMNTVADTMELLRREGVPSWNYVLADTKGNTGYVAVGRIYRRTSNPGYGIQKSSYAGFMTREILSPNEKPQIYNPKRGYVATANHRQWADDAALWAGRGHARAFRGYRIEELILATPKHDYASVSAIQCDDQFVDARFLLPRALPMIQPKTPAETYALQLLKDWNFKGDTKCLACAVWERLRDRLEIAWTANENAIYRMLGDIAMAGQLNTEFAAAVKDLGATEPGKVPTWGQVHRAYFEHVSSGDLFKSDFVGTPGNGSSIDMGQTSWRDGYWIHDVGPSQRLIVEMTDPPRVHQALTGPNLDVENRTVSAVGAAWHDWADCKVQDVAFPFDLSKVRSEELWLK